MKGKIEIVSHPLCPLAQRLVLIALIKGWQRDVDFKVTYLDFRTFPEKILNYSPAGESPILLADGAIISTSIDHAAEYLDALAAPALLPMEPALRLTVRRRERRTMSALSALRMLFTAKNRTALDEETARFFFHLSEVDRDLREDDASGRILRMDMVALAPLFSLATFHKGLREHKAWDDIPRLHDIAKNQSVNAWVVASRCPNYAEEFQVFFEVTGSAFPSAFAV